MSHLQLNAGSNGRKSRSRATAVTIGLLATILLLSFHFSASEDRTDLSSSPSDDTATPRRPLAGLASSLSSLRRRPHSTFAQHALSSPAATQSCEVCIATPNDPHCEYGLDNIRLSKSFEGSGQRVRKVLQRAIRGEEVRIGILGASVTAGHNLWGAQAWPSRFFEDFKRMFPTAKLYDGSAPAMDSSFYSYCFKELVPPDMDMYLVELDINNPTHLFTLDADDDLFRGLLGLPQEPAVMRVSIFALSLSDLTRGSMSSLLLSNYFDVPNIGIRNILIPHLLEHEDAIKDYFSTTHTGDVDTRHASALTHRMLGDMVSLYIREQVCEVKRRAAHPPTSIASDSLWPKGDTLGKLPRLKVHHPYDNDYVSPPVTPTCHILTAKDESKMLQPSGPDGWQKQWKKEEWNGKAAWQSSEVGAQISFDFTGTKVGIFVYASNGAGYKIRPGRAACWANDDIEKKVIVDAFTTEGAAAPRFNVIAEGLPYKKQSVTCEIIPESSTGDHDLRIVGVASQ